jgi:flavin-dependent dehydrogenase
MSHATTDVLIMGGGLAGLSLAIQLKQRDPTLQVCVIERRKHPVREAAFKVGESTVEIGAHYFAHTLGFADHLENEQIRKFGFRFFFSEGQDDIPACTEVGVSQILPTPSWQLDRGRFENFLGQQAHALGVEFIDEAVVRDLHIGSDGDLHQLHYVRARTRHVRQARWLVDASGRAALIKRQLGLAQSNEHDVNAVWWRVDGHVDPNQWGSDPAWLSRCDPPDRWRSTNHMCGPGYWFWLIPLSSGAHSLGIVCDARMHPLDTMDTHDKAMAWLYQHQPRVAASIDTPAHALQDYMSMRHFSHGCKQVFSADRWALTGEAGVFLDPFYSPGSDFIAISNGYICDMIERDRAGKSFAAHAQIYQQLYFSFYENTLTLYQDQYPLFGDALVMPLKVIWDYTYYWSVLAPLYFAGKLTDIALLGSLRASLDAANTLNRGMQALLRQWGQRNQGPLRPDQRLLDQYRIGWFHELNHALNAQDADDALRSRISGNVQRMHQLAAELLAAARQQHPDIDSHGLDVELAGVQPDASRPLLEPHWYGH